MPIVEGNRKGEYWIVGVWMGTLYDHGNEPDARSCYTSGALSRITGTCTAGSAHPSGVNVLLADGHVRSVRREVNRSVWRSLGTRSGGEVISGSFEP